MNRRAFILKTVLGTTAVGFGFPLIALPKKVWPYPKKQISRFCKSLVPIGRTLQEEGYYVWCNSPIYGADGKVHLFYSRWPARFGMGGWLHKCEIAHAVANAPEDIFTYRNTALMPREGFFDATTCHNPSIHKVGDTYYLFYMGNSNGKTNTKRIGLATSKSLDGPWERSDNPLIETGSDGEWDDHCTTNPAFVQHPDGRFFLYYKSWNTHEYETAARDNPIKGNRKYGLAIASQPEGPYVKFEGNPIVDFSSLGGNQQLEDAYVWYQNGKFRLIARDMGFYDHDAGLLFESRDGLTWSQPQIAYLGIKNYVDEPEAPAHLKRYGRLERPQLLLKNGKPQCLFCAAQGGQYMTSTSFVLKIS